MESKEAQPDILNEKCQSRSVLRHLTDRWTPMIVAVLAEEEWVRFKTLKERVQGISPKVLTETLRSMERDGLINRKATASIPPRVDYQLTALGKTTVEPLNALRLWAETHVKEVEDNRKRYDRQLVVEEILTMRKKAQLSEIHQKLVESLHDSEA